MHRRVPPSLKLIMAFFLGLGPFLWMPLLAAVGEFSSNSADVGWSSANQWLSFFGTAILVGLAWWPMALLGGFWFATIAPTMLAGVVTWKLLHLVAEAYPNAYRLRAACVTICVVVAGATSALAFFLLTVWSATLPIAFGAISAALVGGVLGVLLGLCFRKVHSPPSGASSLLPNMSLDTEAQQQDAAPPQELRSGQLQG